MEIRPLSSLVVATLCLFLTACDGEPSTSELQGVFERLFAARTGVEITGANLQFGGKAPGHLDDPTEVSNLRKTACSPGAEDGYDCTFSIVINGLDRSGLKGHFHKGPDGRWVVD